MKKAKLMVDVVEVLAPHILPESHTIFMEIQKDITGCSTEFITPTASQINIGADILLEDYNDWDIVKFMAHELIHIKQLCEGVNFDDFPDACFDPANLEYWFDPDEVEARAYEDAFGSLYLKLKNYSMFRMNFYEV